MLNPITILLYIENVKLNVRGDLPKVLYLVEKYLITYTMNQFNNCV